MFKHFESCGLVFRHAGPCECGNGMLMTVRTRNDAGVLCVNSYCPACILRDIDTVRRDRDQYKEAAKQWQLSYEEWRDRAQHMERQRDDAVTACEANIAQSVKFRHELSEARGSLETHKASNKLLREAADQFKSERDDAIRMKEGAQRSITSWERSYRDLEKLARDRTQERDFFERADKEARAERDQAYAERETLRSERDEARALAQSADAALTRVLNARDARDPGGKYGAWSNGVCTVHGCYQIAVEKGNAPAICCPECTRADLERDSERRKVLCAKLEGMVRDAQNERDRAQSRANCAEEEKRTRDERVKQLQDSLATVQIERNEARRETDTWRRVAGEWRVKAEANTPDGKASPVNHPSASTTDLHSVEYAEGFAAGREDGRRATHRDGYDSGCIETAKAVRRAIDEWVKDIQE